jgi:hypothetical protein
MYLNIHNYLREDLLTFCITDITYLLLYRHQHICFKPSAISPSPKLKSPHAYRSHLMRFWLAQNRSNEDPQIIH